MVQSSPMPQTIIPQRMRAIEITTPGGPDVLLETQRPVPSPNQDEVLIKVSAAGINRPDILQRMGAYPPPEGASDLPGLEVAGEIVATGKNIDKKQIGQQVCALLPGGGYAEYAVADARLCLPVPGRLTMIEAAGIPETFFTVWTNVFEDAGLKKGETLLVHGGTSGIGTTALSLATAFGANFIGTAGTDEKCALLIEMGAQAAYNYREADWEKAIIDSGGADVILDMVGGDYVSKNINCLKPGGRHVSIAFLRGTEGTVNILQLMRNRLRLSGSTLRARTIEEKARIANALHENVWPMIQATSLFPTIFQTFPLAQAADAHKLMEEGTHIGKIILTMDGH